MRILLLLSTILMFTSVLFAQSEQIEQSASVVYHIHEKIEKKNLPAINWILEEQEIPLDIKDILQGNFKDSKK